MQIQINAADVKISEAIEKHVHAELAHPIRIIGDQLTRIEVHLHDQNKQKGGVDKRCVMEARLAGLQPLAVEAVSDDLYDAIRLAAGKLERAVEHKLARLRQRRR